MLRDHLGSTSVIVDAAGAKLWEDRYYPFGDIRHTWKKTNDLPLQTAYRYTGQRHEVGIGLYDYRSRWYDPVLGKFVQADTIVPEPGDPQSLNRYAYTLNNPVKYNDPSGHRWVEDNDANPCRVVGGCEAIRNEGYIEHPQILKQQASKRIEPVRNYAKEFVGNMMRPAPFNVLGQLLSQVGLSLPDQTMAVNIGYIGGIGVLGRMSTSVAVDTQGNIALLRSGGGGVGDPISAGGVSITLTNASSVMDLEGSSINIGGYFGELLSTTGELIIFPDKKNLPRIGVTLGEALSAQSPITVYESSESAKIVRQISLSKIIDFWFDTALEVMYGHY